MLRSILSKSAKIAKPSNVRFMSAWSNTTLHNNFHELPHDSTIVEYVWVGGTGIDLRSKVKVLHGKNIQSVEDLPDWNYDGSSTDQAPGDDSEVTLKPRRLFPHPFHPNAKSFLVMCDTYDGEGNPLPTNSRAPAAAIMDPITEEKNPMFAFEQEYSMFHENTHLGFPKDGGYPAPQGPYYCSVGAENCFGREVADAHMHACLYAGITVSGTNAEVMAGQWEFQVGPVVGIDAADQLMMGRFLLDRVGEMYGIRIEIDPKPVSGDWNGAGCHTNFCIRDFHLDDGEGMKNIVASMSKFEAKHMEHMELYGEGNERRLTGLHETQHIGKFSYGVADRGSSIRIPRPTAEKGRGYIEDRRPASNCDPYKVAGKIMDTLLN